MQVANPRDRLNPSLIHFRESIIEKSSVPESQIKNAEITISLPQGILYAQEWVPPESGSKTPVILMHDSLGCVELWRDFPMHLAQATGRRVIVYDRLGFGKSDGRGAKQPLGFVTEEAEVFGFQIRDALEIDEFIMLGQSVGGAMALASAVLFPNACEAVISVSAQVYVEEKTLKKVEQMKMLFSDPEKVARLKPFHGEKIRWVLDSWFDTWLDPDFASWNLRAELSEITCPTLTIQGERDEYLTASQINLIAGSVKGRVTQHIIADCGHTPHAEKPEELVAVVAKFLEKV